MPRQDKRTKQVQSLKQEVLTDLRRNGYPTQSNQYHNLVEKIKQEVALDLQLQQEQGEGEYNQTPYAYPDRVLVDSLKQDVLFQLQGPNNPYLNPAYQPNSPYMTERRLIDTVKKEVTAQMETEQEAREENQAQGQVPFQYGYYPDRATVDAIKRDVLYELRLGSSTSNQYQGGGVY